MGEIVHQQEGLLATAVFDSLVVFLEVAAERPAVVPMVSQHFVEQLDEARA